MTAVRVETRRVYRVTGGRSRFSRRAAYREAARVRIRAACYCSVDETGGGEQCRFHGGGAEGYAYMHCDAVDNRFGGCVEAPAETPETDRGRAYYLLVRERLMRWLAWADGVES